MTVKTGTQGTVRRVTQSWEYNEWVFRRYGTTASGTTTWGDWILISNVYTNAPNVMVNVIHGSLNPTSGWSLTNHNTLTVSHPSLGIVFYSAMLTVSPKPTSQKTLYTYLLNMGDSSSGHTYLIGQEYNSYRLTCTILDAGTSGAVATANATVVSTGQLQVNVNIHIFNLNTVGTLQCLINGPLSYDVKQLNFDGF
jgi:hypothetical protein